MHQVGYVPAARRPYAGVCFPGGGVCLLWGVGGMVCLVWGGWCVCLVLGGGMVCLVGGVVCLVRGGGVSGPGGGLPHCLVGYHHPPVNRMTNRCKNITLATTSLRPGTIYRTSECSSSRLLKTGVITRLQQLITSDGKDFDYVDLYVMYLVLIYQQNLKKCRFRTFSSFAGMSLQGTFAIKSSNARSFDCPIIYTDTYSQFSNWEARF